LATTKVGDGLAPGPDGPAEHPEPPGEDDVARIALVAPFEEDVTATQPDELDVVLQRVEQGRLERSEHGAERRGQLAAPEPDGARRDHALEQLRVDRGDSLEVVP
jgi:hypothetical protein